MNETGKILADLTAKTVKNIRYALLNGDLPSLNKSYIKKKTESEAKAANGIKVEFTGDNWRWSGLDDTGDPLMPQLSASIAFTTRDSESNITACSIATIQESGFEALVALPLGCYLYREGIGYLVTGVNRAYLDLPIELNHGIKAEFNAFGRKSTLHWTTMDFYIGRLNRMGIPTLNDMGPFYAIMNWFALAHFDSDSHTAIIMPRNIAVSEPFCNKAKEEIVAFIVQSLNQALPEEQQFAITDMSNKPLFTNWRMEKAGEACDTEYAAAGFIIAPTRECHQTVLAAFREAVEMNRKIIKLAQDLDRAEIKPLIKNV